MQPDDKIFTQHVPGMLIHDAEMKCVRVCVYCLLYPLQPSFQPTPQNLLTSPPPSGQTTPIVDQKPTSPDIVSPSSVPHGRPKPIPLSMIPCHSAVSDKKPFSYSPDILGFQQQRNSFIKRFEFYRIYLNYLLCIN